MFLLINILTLDSSVYILELRPLKQILVYNNLVSSNHKLVFIQQHLMASLINLAHCQNPYEKDTTLILQYSYESVCMGGKKPYLGTLLRTVQCWVWIEFRQCLLRASELTQPSLSNIIRHIHSRVQCKSKQSTCHWSCCIRILFVRHVNKHAVTSTGHIYCQCMLESSSKF